MRTIIQTEPGIGRLSPAVVPGSDDAAARILLRDACAPIGFDRSALLAAVASFPIPRSPGQLITSGTWGVQGGSGALRPSWVTFAGPNGSLVASEGAPVRRADPGTVVGGAGLGWREGRSFRLVLGPGLAACASFDVTRRDRAADRAREASRREIDLVIGRPLFKPWPADSGTPSRQVLSWSSKSRARMVKGFASVDWSGLSRCYCGESMSALVHTYVAFKRCDISSPMPLGMVTLTYPGDWLAVASNGAAAKRHLALFRQRWARALGWRLDGAWKLEFQRARSYGNSIGQQAPHFHLLVPIPATVNGVDFRAWLSATWADVVGAVGDERERHEAAGTNVDFGRTAKMSDPKRCAIYFLKHGSKSLDDKEYQHIVPAAWQTPGDGPGRFWGFWGMASASVALDLDMGDWITARRVLRHVARSRAAGVAYSRAKGSAESAGRPGWEVTKGERRPKLPNLGSVGRLPRARRLRTLGAGGQLSGGWVVVNDGPALAGALARAVALRRDVEYFGF